MTNALYPDLLGADAWSRLPHRVRTMHGSAPQLQANGLTDVEGAGTCLRAGCAARAVLAVRVSSCVLIAPRNAVSASSSVNAIGLDQRQPQAHPSSRFRKPQKTKPAEWRVLPVMRSDNQAAAATV